MLIRIIGWIWVLTGVLFLIKPNSLKTKLHKKGVKKVKKILFSVAVVLGVSLIVASFKMQGVFSKIIMVAGIIAIVKGVLFLKAKFAEKLLNWITNQPLIIFYFLCNPP